MAVKYDFRVEYYGKKGTLIENIPEKSSSVEKLWESVSTRLMLYPECFERAVIKVYDASQKVWNVVSSLSNVYTERA